MSSLKIGFVLDDTLDKPDGVQQYVLTIGTWMAAQGHEVHYLVGQTDPGERSNVHSLSKNVSVRFNRNRLSIPLPANRIRIRALLRREQFDVLHVQMPYSPMLAARVIEAAPATTAVIGTFHILPFSWLEGAATKVLKAWLRKSRKRFDAVVSVSKPAAQFARTGFGMQSVVVPNAVDMKVFEQARALPELKSPSGTTIMFLGRLVERKGSMELLKAIATLQQRRDISDVRVVICGKGVLKEKLQEFVRAHKLEKIVHFSGFVSETDKPHYLASADIAVFPSLGGESFGIVLIEAMAAGSSVVLAGNNPGYSSVMDGRSQQLINPSDTPAFAHSLERYLEDKTARHIARQWQHDHVRQFDVNVVGEKLVNIYHDAIAKREHKQHNGDQHGDSSEA